MEAPASGWRSRCSGLSAFRSRTVLVKLAYPYGVDPVGLLALRMAFALPFFLLMGWKAEAENLVPA